jgi:hypothetical protein
MVLDMIDEALLASIAQQMMSSNTVDVNGNSVVVSRWGRGLANCWPIGSPAE